MLPSEAELSREALLAERTNFVRVRCLSRHAVPDAEHCPHCQWPLTTDPQSQMTHYCPGCRWWAGRPWFRQTMECPDCGDQFIGRAFDPKAATGWCDRCVDRFDTNVHRWNARRNAARKPDAKPSRPTESEPPF